MIEWVTEPVALGAAAGSGSVEWLAETVETYQPTGTLEDLVPSVRPEFDALVAQAQAWGMAPHVRSVGRTCAQQEANVKAGASHADLCRGMHVLGHAVDLDLSPNTCATYTKLGAWWEARGGVWGGRWTQFGPCGDSGHFHYGFDGAGAVPTSVCPSGVSLEQCKRIREDYLDQAFGEAPVAPSKWGLAAGIAIVAVGVAFVWATTRVRPGAMALTSLRENPSSSAERWKKLRADYLVADREYDALDIELSVRYGRREWAPKAQLNKLEQIRKRKGRIGDKMLALLDQVSPRDWHQGVPAHWIYSSLKWEDAIRPLNEPLSVTPPLAYGHTSPMRTNPLRTR